MINAPIDDLAFKLGTTLYIQGKAAIGLFTLRTGMIKLMRTTAGGRLRIVRVLRPGDVAGLEVLVTSQYDSEAVALTDISICRIPLDVVHRLAANSQRLHFKLMQKW